MASILSLQSAISLTPRFRSATYDAAKGFPGPQIDFNRMPECHFPTLELGKNFSIDGDLMQAAEQRDQ